MKSSSTDEGVTLALSHAEALVLYEWLTRTDDAGERSYAHDAEQTVLWKLEGALEKSLIAQFAPDYAKLVDAARSTVDNDGPD